MSETVSEAICEDCQQPIEAKNLTALYWLNDAARRGVKQWCETCRREREQARRVVTVTWGKRGWGE